MSRTLTQQSTLLTRMNEDWTVRFAHRELDLGDAGRWAGGDLLRQVLSTSGYTQDVIVGRLLAAAQTGNRHAERVLVQALLPTAVRIASRSAQLDDIAPRDRIGCAVSAVWEVVRTYRPESPEWVMAKLMRAAKRTLDPEPTVNARHLTERTSVVPDDVLERIAGAAPDIHVPAEIRLQLLLATAVEARVITADEATFLVRSSEGNGATSAVAREVGSTASAVRKRRERIRSRLAAAIGDLE